MADILNKDPITYDKEKESFLRELQQFHETRGTPFRNGPKISGHVIDLYLLYALVTGQGGWVKVNSRNEWDKILEELKLPRNCVNCSVAIKQIYLRYLDRYEKVHFLGEVGERVSEDDEDSRHRKWSMRALHSVPLNYNHAQHNVNESLREYNGLSIDLYRASEYDKLGLSLLSPLINEQDFAINVCTLLSNEGKHCLKLDKHPRILHYLLAHAAVFSHTNLRNLYCDHYARVRGHSISRFWHDALCESRLLRLIDESQFENEFEDICLDDEHLISTSDKTGLTFQPEDRDLFCLGRTLGTQDYVGQRVLQVATMLRNLTFIQENLNVMNKDITFLRFVLLCCGSRWSTLHQMGWDMLGNLALDITVLCSLMPEMLGVTVRGLESHDRAQILSSLEVLNKLGQNEKNEDYFLKYLEQRVYDRICSFLTIHDIMLLIYTLECLYSLSSLGEKACNSILKVHGVVDTLVSLITVEAQSYGPKACIQMRVVETVTSITGGANFQNGSNTVTQVSATNSPRPSTPTSVSASPTVLQSSPVPPPLPQPQLVQAQLVTSVPPVQPRVPVAANSPAPSSIHATQQVAQENEQFALAWLRSTFEPNAGSHIEQQELYKQYINYCAKIGRRGVIAPLHFPRCVRSVFGVNVGPKASSASETSQQFFEGIQVRAKPLVPPNPIPPVPQTPSPILKAQLSAPPKPTPPSPQQIKVTQRQQQQKLLQQSHENQQLVSDNQTLVSPLPPTSVINSTITHCLLPVSTVSNVSVIERLPINSIASGTQVYTNKGLSYKINGVRSTLLDNTHNKKENEMDMETIVTSTSGENSSGQPPPLAPLSNSSCIQVTSSTTDHEYTENSLAPVIINVNNNSVSGENSNDCILVNGLSNTSDLEDSNIKMPIPKNLMLADLLEKNVDKSEPPVLNGSLRIGDRGLELVHGLDKENSSTVTFKLPKASPDVNCSVLIKEEKVNLKRSGEELEFSDPKKPHLNGNLSPKEEPPEEGNVSSSAANLYAALAADALEDEPIEETPEAPVIVATANQQPRQILVTTGAQITQRVVVSGQHYVVAQPQTALVQGQTQTVLVAQTAQQQGTGAKTIIILQPQNVSTGSSQQKVLVQSLQSGPLPPLITSSQPSPIVRSKSPPKPPPTPPLPQQAILQQNLVKSLPANIISTHSQVVPSIATVTMPVMPAPCATPVNVPMTTSVITVASATTTSSSTPISSSANDSIPSSENPVKPIEKGHFLCEWRGCMRNFKSGNEVYMHACEAHCPQGTQEIQCLWERCDAMKRKRFSHMTHLYDRHCNADVMRIMAVRRKQLSTSGRTEIPPPTPPTPHPGYAPNAAFHAIKRHALEFVNPKELQDDNEGPVTKSIRLTSALILRNLVIFSTNGRRYLSRFEPHLANVALSSVESSRTIAQVLYDMSQHR